MAKHRRIEYLYMFCKQCNKVSDIIQYTKYFGFGSQSKEIRWLCHDKIDEEKEYYHRRSFLFDDKPDEPLELVRYPLEGN